MELAEGKPIERRLMAAMAQLDCGSCGYLCQTYSEAIASGAESNLTLCSPGGKETKQMIKKLLKESDNDQLRSAVPSPNGAVAKPSGWSRQNPFPAKLVESRALNQPGSTKDTRHVAIDLADSGLSYDVGDAIGVYPKNCHELAMTHCSEIGGRSRFARRFATRIEKDSVLQTLVEDACLRDPSDELSSCLSIHTASAQAKVDVTGARGGRTRQKALTCLTSLNVARRCTGDGDRVH